MSPQLAEDRGLPSTRKLAQDKLTGVLVPANVVAEDRGLEPRRE